MSEKLEYHCYHCEDIFTSYIQVKQHEETAHAGCKVDPLVKRLCLVCNKGIHEDLVVFEAHIRRNHTHHRPYYDDIDHCKILNPF